MICLTKNEQGAELLTGYLAKTLDAAGMAEVDRHIQDCAECRGLVSVWEKLDEFAAPEVTAGFDARLYARIVIQALSPKGGPGLTQLLDLRTHRLLARRPQVLEGRIHIL